MPLAITDTDGMERARFERLLKRALKEARDVRAKRALQMVGSRNEEGVIKRLLLHRRVNMMVRGTIGKAPKKIGDGKFLEWLMENLPAILALIMKIWGI